MSINVINRRGEQSPLKLETISTRLQELANMDPRLSVSTDVIAIKTVASLVNGIKTSEIDRISANICASMIIDDHEYDDLAARITISDLHKNTTSDLVKYANELIEYEYRGKKINILHPKVVAFIKKYHSELERIINYNKDYMNNFFGSITLINSYLLSYKFDNDVKITKERPQQMLLRVAIGINMDNIDDSGSTSRETFESIVSTYNLLSDRYYTHATPTLFNAGTINHTLSSCYLLAIDDNLDNIYSRLTDISKISKFSGGVGIHLSQVRASGSVIASTIGRSEGLVPLMRVYNESTRYVSQGGGKRKGSTAVYIEPWHADIESAILSQKQQGAPERLCRDLFLALWMPDLFMSRLKQSLKTGKPVMWSLMCPNECPRLTDTYGAEFEALYTSYEEKKMYRKQVPIKELWELIMATQIETGKPYLMYKDHVNRKTNQNHLGVIKSSNLCVHGDTLILTDEGYVPIKSVSNENVKIWDTTKFVSAPVRKTAENQKLLKIKTSDGCDIKCTYYHRFEILDNYRVVVKEAQHLKKGDMLTISEYPLAEGNADYNMKYAYTHGYSCGVWTNDIIIDEHNKKLKSSLEYAYEDADHLVLHNDMPAKFQVPINATPENKIQWLAGFIDSVGIFEDGYIMVQSPNRRFLMNIKLLSNTIKCNPQIKELSLGFQLRFTHMDVKTLINDLKMELRLLEVSVPKVKDFERVRIESIEEVDGLHDTYCFRSIDTEKGIFGGMPTMNCSEITIYSDEKNIGVCNLASVCLPKFVKMRNGEPWFDYEHLGQVMQTITINMNKVIDNNKYPLEQAKHSDDMNRPIGIGVQGLAEVFMLMRTSFDSPLAAIINKKIFETMYYHALVASNKLAQVDGPFKTFSESMTARGTLQFDLWGIEPTDMWDWKTLKRDIINTGLRNSLLMALMPTAGTSIISGHTEGCEPPQSNIFTRSTLSGRFQVVNKHLMRDLKQLGLWTKSIRNQIIANDGSIQAINDIPQQIRDIYKTVYEYKLTSLIKMNADRECYVCQASSNNRYLSSPDMGILTNMHLYTWKYGLKCSSYYCRVKQLKTGAKLIGKVEEQEEVECLSCQA